MVKIRLSSRKKTKRRTVNDCTNTYVRCIIVIVSVAAILPFYTFWKVGRINRENSLLQVARQHDDDSRFHTLMKSQGQQLFHNNNNNKAGGILPDYDDLPDPRNAAIALVDMFGSSKIPYIRGSRDYYTPAPKDAWGKFVASGKGEKTIRRLFVGKLGWTEVDRRNITERQKYDVANIKTNITTDSNEFQKAIIFFQFRAGQDDQRIRNLLPYQRYGRIPKFDGRWESKDDFLNVFREYATKIIKQKQHKQYLEEGRTEIMQVDDVLWFLPLTYRLTKENSDRQAFLDRLSSTGEGGTRGMDYPWVLKQVNLNNGRGIEMLPPNSEALRTAVDRAVADSEATYIVQQYICNELKWFGGQKFDLRMYWFVASIDPFIAMYEDGFVRVGKNAYDESDWNTTGQHLTNLQYRGKDTDVSHRHLWKRVQDHYDANKDKFQSDEYGNIIDPVRHVRNQIKESLAHLVAATKTDIDAAVRKRGHNEENLFGFYGCDFIIDEDLDVFFIESQSSPGIGDRYSYRAAMWDRIFPPMILTVEEIARKQQQNASANIFPLENLGGWELVYAGDTAFEYKGYKRTKNKKSCSLPNSELK